MQLARTKEENFVLKLHKRLDEGEWISLSLLAKEWELKPKTLNNLINQFAQANFIKKNKDSEICMTEHGRKLALNLEQ